MLETVLEPAGALASDTLSLGAVEQGESQPVIRRRFPSTHVRTAVIDRDARLCRMVINTADVDRYKTIVDPAGVVLDRFMQYRSVLLDHGLNPRLGSLPIGQASRIYHSGNKLIAEFQMVKFDNVSERSDSAKLIEDIWYLFERGLLCAASVGFIPISYRTVSINGEDVILYDNWEMVEFSLVSVPANPFATVVDEKALRIYRRIQPTISACTNVLTRSMLESMKHEQDVLRRLQSFSNLVGFWFDRDFFSREEAQEWLEVHGLPQAAHWHEGDGFISTVATDDGVLMEDVDSGIKAIVGRATKPQSLIFDKQKFSKDEAVAWARERGFRHDKVDETENSWRLRQFDPELCTPGTFGTKELTDGVQAVFCEVKGESKAASACPEDLAARASSTRVNSDGVSHAKSLIRAGKVDMDSNWEFSADGGNKLLGENENWDNYAKWFLAVDTSANEKTKERYKFPYGKDGKVFRRGVIAAKQRAAQQGYQNIAEAADELLQIIDGVDTKLENKETTITAPEVAVVLPTVRLTLPEDFEQLKAEVAELRRLMALQGEVEGLRKQLEEERQKSQRLFALVQKLTNELKSQVR